MGLETQRCPRNQLTVVEAKPTSKDLVEDPDNAGMDEQVPERVAPRRVPADEIAQISAARGALEGFRPTREDIPCATLVVGAIDGSKVVVVVDGVVAGSHLLCREDSLQHRVSRSAAVRQAVSTSVIWPHRGAGRLADAPGRGLACGGWVNDG